ncbi:MAG: dienelactone hydrolase family protein [Prosthecobacter sp.]|nr:dienelactone hydrolase family protein [Prosthecobacter sp.]
MKNAPTIARQALHLSVTIATDDVELEGALDLPAEAAGVVVFAHGSGSSRHSPRNQFVARVIREAGMGTLLFDLLTRKEEREDDVTGVLRFDIELLAKRLIGATHWLEKQPETRELKVGYFGASTGGGAALMAAAELGDRIAAVVSRGGRPDLAGAALPRVKSPTLLLVGGCDDVVISLNQEAYAKLSCEKELRIVPGATHLFEEPGKLEQVARISAEWFSGHMGGD